MSEVVLLLVLAGVAVVVVLWLRVRRRKPAVAPRAPVDPLRRESAPGSDPRRIGVGDVISHDGRDFVVRGTLQFQEGGYRWQEHLLDDVEVRYWLSVEDDEELGLAFYQRIQAPELQPGPPSLTHGGVVYTLDEHGTATFSAVGTTGTGPTGHVEYYDYNNGDQRLAFERYGTGSWDVSLGRAVHAYELDIYPSSSSSG